MDLLRRRPNIERLASMSIWPIFIVVLLISLYPFLRYGGWWNLGNDTANFTRAIGTVLDAGQLAPAGRGVYPNGFGFQALSTFLLSLSGLGLVEWQLYGSVLLIVWLVFPAWLLYRELLGSNRGATLAAILLFVQPEFVFGIMRGTHEKFTRGLMLLCLYLLVYSLRSRNRRTRFAASVIAFYLSIFALMTFNNFFTTSFVGAILMALGLVVVIAWWTRSSGELRPTVRRMIYVVAISFVMWFLYVFFLYPPAARTLLTLQSLMEGVATLFAAPGGEETAELVNPYTGPVFNAWISPYVFFALSAVNGLLLLVSGAIWFIQGGRWLVRRQQPASTGDLLLWAFFGAFALQVALTVVSDVTGVLTGNLQHRMFPTVGLVAAPLVARGLLGYLQTSRPPLARAARFVLSGTVGLLFVLTLFKATNEPVFSNQWQVYLPAEVGAIDWAERSLTGRPLWTGLDRRLVEVTEIRSGSKGIGVKLDRLEVDEGTNDFLVSDIARLQAVRLGVPLPVESDYLLTFDNGQAQIYHRRALTPYQR